MMGKGIQVPAFPLQLTQPCVCLALALGLMIIAFWTISIYSLLWQAAKGFPRKQIRKGKQGRSEVRNSA